MRAMKQRLVAGAPARWLATVILLGGLAACGAEPPAAERRISVSGEGLVAGTPDVARITLGVASQAETAAAAMALNAERMQGVFAALESLGVAERDRQTTNLSISPRWRQVQEADGDRRQVIDGYEASNSLRVILRDMDSIGATLDALVEAGANRVSGLTLEIDEQESLLDQARAVAIADARRKAELLAEAADADLGAVISIAETQAGGGPTPVRMERMTATPIAPGEAEIGVSVVVVWELR